jgi:Mycothiol maleylpyruvate isomerase N-terminal domain
MSFGARDPSDARDPSARLSPTWAGFPLPRVLAAQRDGVVSLSRLGAKVVDWQVQTPCADWTLLDLGGHVLTIARYYHRLLNAALGGEPRTGLPHGAQLATTNDLELRSLRERRGPERFLAFEAIATRYGERLADLDWSMTLGVWEGIGPMSVGDHALAAAAEWHIHAWDVARAFGWDYRPDDPDVVLAGQRVFAAATREADVWTAALLAAGRRL